MWHELFIRLFLDASFSATSPCLTYGRFMNTGPGFLSPLGCLNSRGQVGPYGTYISNAFLDNTQ